MRPAARCWHCYVWNEGEGQYLIQCIHCGNVTHRIETLDDADFIARKCRETRVAHNQLCRRTAR